jgi:eukaryotic-like serine/threonine-protein kinase
LAWSPKGDEIWFTAAEAGRRQELRAVTLKGRQRLLLREPFSIRLLDAAKDGRVLVANIQSPARCFFRGEKDAVDRELSWLDSSKIQDLTRDGRFVVMTEDGDGAGASAQTYIRETTGALPMKVGPGYGSFSPDERFVVATLNNPSGIALYPVGPGQPRTVHVEGIGLEDVWGLLPDARTLVFTGNEPSRAIRIWITDLAGSKPRPISPEGVNVVRPLPVTPDGKYVLGVTGQRVGGRILAYPVAGGEPQPFIVLLEGELIARWGLDGQWFFAYRPDVIPIRIFRVNSKTGARTLVHEITPADRAGRIFGIWALTTPDGKAYAYTTQISRSELHLVEGLK